MVIWGESCLNMDDFHHPSPRPCPATTEAMILKPRPPHPNEFGGIHGRGVGRVIRVCLPSFYVGEVVTEGNVHILPYQGTPP